MESCLQGETASAAAEEVCLGKRLSPDICCSWEKKQQQKVVKCLVQSEKVKKMHLCLFFSTNIQASRVHEDNTVNK